jgi:hypothetical protein
MFDDKASIVAATKDTSRITAAGIEFGNKLRRISDPGIKQLEAEGENDTRCASCAFRAGTVPAGCLQTTMDAMKASIEGTVFTCHLAADRTSCHGWYAARVALKGSMGTAPWNYSYDITGEAE